MKILHIIPNLKKGGAERLVLDICNSLKKIQGIKVKLITFEDENQYEYLTTDLDHSVISASVKLSVKGKNKIKVDALQKEINSFKPDIIHTHLFEAEIISRSCYYPKAKWFSHCHSNKEQIRAFGMDTLLKKEKLTNYYEKWYLFKRYRKNGGNNFIAISRDTEKYFKSKVKEYPVTRITNAIDYSRFRTDKKIQTENKIKMVNVGSFVPKKNQEFLIEVSKILKSKHIIFEMRFLGDGQQKTPLEKKARGESLSENVFFHGNVNNVEEYLWDADIYVHSANYEPLGLVLLEAMAAGLPVITLDGKGNRDLIEEGKNGYMISENNPELFANKILQLWNNKNLYRSISDYAKSYAKQFDIHTYTRKLLELYEEN